MSAGKKKTPQPKTRRSKSSPVDQGASNPQRLETGKSVTRPERAVTEDNTRRDKRPNRRPMGSGS